MEASVLQRCPFHRGVHSITGVRSIEVSGKKELTIALSYDSNNDPKTLLKSQL